MNGAPTNRILLDTGASTAIVHQRMVTEKDYTRDIVSITDSGGVTRWYPMARVIIHLQGGNQEVSDVVPEDVLLGRDAPIGVPAFSQQERKAMWKDMN